MTPLTNYGFTFGNLLSYVKTKGILFWSFSFNFGDSNDFSIFNSSDSPLNSVSKNFLLKPRSINDHLQIL